MPALRSPRARRLGCGRTCVWVISAGAARYASHAHVDAVVAQPLAAAALRRQQQQQRQQVAWRRHDAPSVYLATALLFGTAPCGALAARRPGGTRRTETRRRRRALAGQEAGPRRLRRAVLVPYYALFATRKKARRAPLLSQVLRIGFVCV